VEEPTAPSPARPSGWAPYARVLLAVVGIGLLVSIVRHTGPELILSLVREALPWMPLVLALEGARIGCDAIASRIVLGAAARGVGALRLMLAHVVGHGVMNVMPGGRSASEIAKGALLHRELGAGTAAALGTTNQANVLISSGLFSLPCALAASMVSTDRTLVLAMLIHSGVLFAAGLGMRVLQTSARVERFVGNRFPKWSAPLARFHAASRDVALVSPGPVAMMMLGRGMQTLQFALLAYAVGLHVDPIVALAVQGTNLVAAAVGVLVPGQIGSSEGVFMLAANALGTTEARATSVALLAHASSITWAAAGLVLLFAWRSRTARDASENDEREP
jgi:hypothetical protein